MSGRAVHTLVEALLRLIVAVFVEPDVLCGKALHSAHVGTEKTEKIQDLMRQSWSVFDS